MKLKANKRQIRIIILSIVGILLLVTFWVFIMNFIIQDEVKKIVKRNEENFYTVKNSKVFGYDDLEKKYTNLISYNMHGNGYVQIYNKKSYHYQINYLGFCYSNDKIDFTNPNDILEWFDNTCYYTNMMDMNDTIIKIVQLLRDNNYHSFEEIIDNDIIYHNNSYSYYLIGQVISNLEVYGFITEPMIEFINIYIESLNMKKTNTQKSKYISFFH